MRVDNSFQYKRGSRVLTSDDQKALVELNQYRDLLYFPIQLKLEIDHEKFISYFDQYKQDIYTFNTSKKWVGLCPISGPHYTHPSYKIDSQFTETFPTVIKQIQEGLPLKEIHMLHFWEQKVPIIPHQDGGAADLPYHFPWSYRIMLVRSKKPAFFIQPFHSGNVLPYTPEYKAGEILMGDQHFPDFPADSDFFCFNNSGCKHGSIMPEDQKIIGFIDAEIDFPRHLQLIKKSLRSYSSQALYKSSHQVSYAD